MFVDCRLSGQAHIIQSLALGHHRPHTVSKVVTANGVPRKLARKVTWFAMTTAAFGVEAIWKGQIWLFDGFNRLFSAIRRAVNSAFSTTGGKNVMRAADIPPTRPALDRRRGRFLTPNLTPPVDIPRRALPHHTQRATPADAASPDGLLRLHEIGVTEEGEAVSRRKERSAKLRCRARTLTTMGRSINPEETCHAWTDGPCRQSAGLGWLITSDD